MEFIKVDKEKISDLEINANEDVEVYLLKNKDILLGYGIINERLKDNIIYIYVYNEYRSNGYGSIIFKYLYDVLKGKGIKELLFTIDSNNRFNNIIFKYNAIHLGTKNGVIKYVVVVK